MIKFWLGCLLKFILKFTQNSIFAEFWLLTFSAVLLWISSVPIITDANSAMQLYMTPAIKSARVKTARIHTSLIPARLIVGAFRILRAFSFWSRNLSELALNLWIPIESTWTGANGAMIGSLTYRIETACTDARISTALRETSLIPRTISIHDTLGINAESCTIANLAFAIRVTRRWIAGIDFNLLVALVEWIADQRYRTRAKRTVIYGFALSSNTANVSQTRINAFVVFAILVTGTVRA